MQPVDVAPSPSHPFLLEVAANSVASAVAAQDGGAGRVELCSALELGGLTPSHAQIALVRDRLRIPVHVLIRPRAGHFVYGEDDHATMLRDIETCAALGCDGIVTGALDAAGHVDRARCAELIAAAGGMGVTFHRAIDVSRDPLRALDDILALGFERVLSSGAQPSAARGVTLLKEMVTGARGRIAVMPGAGITADSIGTLRDATGAREFHASATRTQRRDTRFVPPDLDMDDDEIRTDADTVRRLVAALADSTISEAVRQRSASEHP